MRVQYHSAAAEVKIDLITFYGQTCFSILQLNVALDRPFQFSFVSATEEWKTN